MDEQKKKAAIALGISIIITIIGELVLLYSIFFIPYTGKAPPTFYYVGATVGFIGSAILIWIYLRLLRRYNLFNKK